MLDMRNASESLERLLKLARADADALRVDLGDIERARAAAAASLTRLAEITKREEEAMQDDAGVDMLAYLEGERERRLQLQASVLTLEAAETRARKRLEAAAMEIKKFEHLLALNAHSGRKGETRREQRAEDDAAASRRAS